MSKANDNTPITKKDLIESLVGFSEAILEGVQRMFDKVDKRFDKVDERFGEVESDTKDIKADITVIKNDIRWMKDDINGLKADLFDTPSKKEFNQLKTKVDDYIATN